MQPLSGNEKDLLFYVGVVVLFYSLFLRFEILFNEILGQWDHFFLRPRVAVGTLWPVVLGPHV